MSEASTTAKPRKKQRPVYFTVRRLVDPATGEEVGALVPMHEVDRRAMRERSYTTGAVIRAELMRPRSVGFHRFAHALGGMIADHIEGYEGLDAHAALKAMQLASGVACDETRTPVPGLGELVSRQAQSLAFDKMPEGEFRAFVSGICHHIAAKHWPHMTPEAVEEMARMMA